MTKTTVAAFALLVCLLAPGCRSAQPDEVRTDMSKGSILISMPPIPHEGKGSCGLDCTISLLRHYGMDIDEEGRRRFPLDEVKKEWISAGELRDYLTYRGFRAAVVHGTLDEARPAGLFRMLEAGMPVIVERKVKGEEHFELVCGFDPERKLVFIMLPDGVGAVPFEKFETAWAAVGHLELVAAPEAKVAPTPPTTTTTTTTTGG